MLTFQRLILMKVAVFICWLSLFVNGVCAARAEQTNSPAPENRNPKLGLLRTNQFFGDPSTNQLQQLENLTPEQRREKIQELRARHAAAGTNPAAIGPTRQEKIVRFKAVTEELRRKKATGAITPAQERQLANFEMILKRLEEQNNKAPSNSLTNSP